MPKVMKRSAAKAPAKAAPKAKPAAKVKKEAVASTVSKKNASKTGAVAVVGRCFKCKETREMLDSQVVQLQTGQKMRSGRCATCGAGMSVMVAAATPVDHVQTKKEAAAASAKKVERNKNSLAKLKEKQATAKAPAKAKVAPKAATKKAAPARTYTRKGRG